MNNLLSKTSTGKGTSNPRLATEVDNENEEENKKVEEEEEINNDPIAEPRHDGVEITIILEPNPIPIKLEDSGSEDKAVDIARWDDSGFTAYQSPSYMQTLNLVAEGGLKFPDLTHKRLGHVSSSTNFNHVEVGMEF
ncbi:hypothetical protein GOBAR_AA15279 [Gossypium barbadense]|uniref:Uncharacterized protein n=1 Tax=Gossypium barbadense TaxID=3634 RepID=A0A2P5XPX9_GOSBA|nr:hypothetical protein GOBAR_AA15279 [Gossypium barbadense]